MGRKNTLPEPLVLLARVCTGRKLGARSQGRKSNQGISIWDAGIPAVRLNTHFTYIFISNKHFNVLLSDCSFGLKALTGRAIGKLILKLFIQNRI